MPSSAPDAPAGTDRPHASPPATHGRMLTRDKRWWAALVVVVLGSFAVLLWSGLQINTNKPPIPQHVVTTDGKELFGPSEVMDGQHVWQSIGGQEVGSVWGHGAYVAPDWTADWLHRESTFMLDRWAKEEGGTSFDQLDAEKQAALKARLAKEMKTNTYDEKTGTITVSPLTAEAIEANVAYYTQMFKDGHTHYAIPKNSVKDPQDARKMMAFFWWSSWAAHTNAPGHDVTYTQNWPHEPLIGNEPPVSNLLWSIISIIMLLAGIGGMIWYHNATNDEAAERPEIIPANDPLLGYRATPSQRATLKYFYVVGLLFVLQMSCGILAAHYGVEGGGLYGIPIESFLPYQVVRAWHTQLGIFWIATAWLATGLYVGPAVGGREPKGQRLGVNILFGALIVVVLGSMAGEWLSMTGHMTPGSLGSWWFGTSGLEYVDLARIFQIGLFVGLFLWFFLMWRAMAPALRKAKGGELAPSEDAPLAGGSQRTLVLMLLISCLAIAGFYGAAFGMGRNSHLSVIEYWRWWVVHLWVEGFFEVFATVVISFLLARLGLVRASTATTATLASTVIFLSGGIIGTLHHLYFTGATSQVVALGAVFSALEVVPLSLVGFDAFKHLRILKVAQWAVGYKWAIYFFVSVAFWNMLGAGVFGFLINPPISLFYVQGLNLTPLHGHTALFGVYGMLGVGLMLFCVRGLMPGREWKETWIRWGFWGMNIGLLAMALLSLLPLGLAQAYASMKYGLWRARSDEFLYNDTLTVIRWMRIPGDTLFAIGALAIGVFMVGLLTGWSFKDGKGLVRAGSLHMHLDDAEDDVAEAEPTRR